MIADFARAAVTIGILSAGANFMTNSKAHAAAAATVQAAQSEHELEVRNKAIISKAFDAWADGTGGPYDLLADDVNWTITGNSLAGKTYPSREAFMSQVIRPFNGRMQTRLVPSVRHIYADGNTIIVFFDAKGTAKDGKLYSNTYAWILEMRDGKIAKATAFFDALEFDDLWKRVPAN